jgi:exoribonuclease R
VYKKSNCFAKKEYLVTILKILKLNNLSIMKNNEKIIWKFQWGSNFGFLIPEDREYYGWDFYVNKNNFWLAEDWDRVEWVEIKTKWKKPEVKIVRVYWKEAPIKQEFVEWIYSSWDGNFWFIDVEWLAKGYFVYWNKKNWAKDWDKVKAQIVEFKWKKEAVVVKIFQDEFETVVGRFKDSDRFGFVIPDEWTNNDVFIPGPRKNWARDWDIVEAKIIKKWWKNPEGFIVKILD